MGSIRSSEIKNREVVVLCGGLGTRMQQLFPNMPKVMVDLHGYPFLEILIDYYFRQGFNKFILCVGYKKKYIERYFKQGHYAQNIVFSEEINLLGTAGALKKAEKFIESDNFLVVNGDSFCEIDTTAFFRYHFVKRALVSIAVVVKDAREDTGKVHLNKQSLVISFGEKIKASGGYINAGVYIFNKKILNLIPPDRQVSLEFSLFPELVKKNFYGFPLKTEIFDIGTPERYNRACLHFKNKLK